MPSFLFDLFTAVCLRGPEGVSPEERVVFLLNVVPLPDPGQRLSLRCFPGAGSAAYVFLYVCPLALRGYLASRAREGGTPPTNATCHLAPPGPL